MREIARAHGRECISKRYVNSTTPLRWRCANGHVWEAAPDRLKAHNFAKRGAWCAECYHEAQKKSIDEMQRIAHAKGGQCLSLEFKRGRHCEGRTDNAENGAHKVLGNG
jgi:hypothetical protein